MVLQALLAFPDQFAETTGAWHIDNIAALMALIRGRSDNEDLDKMAQMIHLCLFQLRATIWWEWVQSNSNWTDSISGRGFQDPFALKRQFRVHSAAVCPILWILPLSRLLQVISFLA